MNQITLSPIDTEVDHQAALKLAVMRTAQYFKERAERTNMTAFWEILEQAGSEEPRVGDEVPEAHL